MNSEEQEQVLRVNTTLFVKHAAQCFKDLVNADFSIMPSPKVQGMVEIEHGFVVIAHFSGSIQGDFIFSTTEMTAAKIAGAFPADNSLMGLMKGRVVFSDVMREVLNVSAQLTLANLSRSFGALTLLPSSWVFGEYHTADFISGIGVIGGIHGQIHCSLSLNMVSIAGVGKTSQPRLPR
jgi:CheY-specific phosphatase CheX